jgi:hypothetical protein
MNSSPKLTLRSLPKKDERNKDYIPKYDNLNNRKCRSNDLIQNKSENEISDCSKQNNAQQQKNMRQSNVDVSENVWSNNNVPKELFSNAQSLTFDRTKEVDELSLSLTESIYTAQQENEKHKMFTKNLNNNIQDKSDNNNWFVFHYNYCIYIFLFMYI